MKVVLLIAMIYSSGEAATVGVAFNTLTECNAKLLEVPVILTRANTTEEVKVVAHAAACVVLDKTPQGTGV